MARPLGQISRKFADQWIQLGRENRVIVDIWRTIDQQSYEIQLRNRPARPMPKGLDNSSLGTPNPHGLPPSPGSLSLCGEDHPGEAPKSQVYL